MKEEEKKVFVRSNTKQDQLISLEEMEVKFDVVPTGDSEVLERMTAELESYKQGFWGRMAARNQIALRKAEAELANVRELAKKAYTSESREEARTYLDQIIGNPKG